MKSHDTRKMLLRLLHKGPTQISSSIKAAHDMVMIMTCKCGEWYRECDC